MKEARKDIDDALYELGALADVLEAVAVAHIAANHPVCGSSVDWFARLLNERLGRIEGAAERLGGAR